VDDGVTEGLLDMLEGAHDKIDALGARVAELEAERDAALAALERVRELVAAARQGYPTLSPAQLEDVLPKEPP
jgi:hypothetical protein